MVLKLPKYTDKRQELEKALAIAGDFLPTDSIEGLITYSKQAKRDLIKVRIHKHYDLEKIVMPKTATNIKRDKESILFEYNGFSYYIFNQS